MDSNYWVKRSKVYNKLEWVCKEDFLGDVFTAGDFKQYHTVLDIGTGTGVVANRIAPYVKEVFALDNSREMMQQSELQDNIYFIPKDIRDLFFTEGIFDRITARMVFHHILEGRNLAMDICYRYLVSGGLMVLAEGVPPSSDCYDEFKHIFQLKEERVVFTEDDLLELMVTAGFIDIVNSYHINKKFSVMNWLDNNNISKHTKEEIFDLHINASEKFKKAYNMETTENDCFIDVKSVIMVGKKG